VEPPKWFQHRQLFAETFLIFASLQFSDFVDQTQGKVSAAGSAWLSPHTKKLQVDEPETRLDLAVNQREPMPRPFFKWTTTIADHMATSDDIVLYFATHDDTVCGWKLTKLTERSWWDRNLQHALTESPTPVFATTSFTARMAGGWASIVQKPWIQGSRTFLGFGPRICTSGAPRS